jgi:NADH:ubiquinone oxidoreductase subunit C
MQACATLKFAQNHNLKTTLQNANYDYETNHNKIDKKESIVSLFEKAKETQIIRKFVFLKNINAIYSIVKMYTNIN